jgi:hypothetical protein
MDNSTEIDANKGDTKLNSVVNEPSHQEKEKQMLPDDMQEKKHDGTSVETEKKDDVTADGDGDTTAAAVAAAAGR